MAPAYIIDYIVVHEMCHMHHKDLWNMVGRIKTDYNVRKTCLGCNGVKLDL